MSRSISICVSAILILLCCCTISLADSPIPAAEPTSTVSGSTTVSSKLSTTTTPSSTTHVSYTSTSSAVTTAKSVNGTTVVPAKDDDCGFFSAPNELNKEFLMHSLGTTVDMRSSYGNIQDYEESASYWKEAAKTRLHQQLSRKFNTNIAKSAIIFLGDGMSLSTITASRIHVGQQQGKPGEEHSLSFENFPHTALSKTYCVDKQTADSACSATAYLMGVKTNYATIGVTAKVKHNDCSSSLIEENRLSSIMKWAQDAGKSTGIVTTTRVTHASPAGNYAKTANRDWESDFDMSKFTDTEKCSDIAKQLITESPGLDLNVIFGGGRKKFLSNNTTLNETKGERLDGRNLVSEWLEKRDSSTSQYVSNKTELLSLNYRDVDHVLGLFADSHLQYNLQNDKDEPSLKEMTIAALEILQKNNKGYVLFVEGGKIDLAHHENMARIALDETAEFDKAIKSAVELTSEDDTLIVVTADHSHTMTLAGYSHRGADILGLNSEVSDVDSMHYLTLSYANGPSAKNGRQVDADKIKNIDSRYPSLVPLLYETHGGEDVPIYARGPFSHLFEGVLEQSTIPHFIAFAACIGDGPRICDNKCDKNKS